MRIKVLYIYGVVLCGVVIIFSIYQFEEFHYFVRKQLTTNTFQTISFHCSSNKLMENSLLPPWLIVDNRSFVGLSAYYDSYRDSSVVRVLGIRHLGDWRKILCIHWTSNDSKSWKINLNEGQPDYLNEVRPCLIMKLCVHHPYDAFYIYCHINQTDYRNFRHNFISLIASERFSGARCENNFLTTLPKLEIRNITNSFIHTTENQIILDNNDYKIYVQLAVCVSPTFQWDNVLLLKLFLEHYLSQGFTKFLLFKRSWSTKIDDVLLLKQYAKHVEIIDWPPFLNDTLDDLNNDNNVHYRAQVLAMNECLWRLRGRARFVASVDFDEFLTPVANKTLADLVQAEDQSHIGGFVFRNRFITFDLTNLSADALCTLDENIIAYPVRTKLIVKPETVEKLGIHSVWRYLDGYKDKHLSTDVGLLYHYKPRNYGSFSGTFLADRPRFSQIFPKLPPCLKDILVS